MGRLVVLLEELVVVVLLFVDDLVRVEVLVVVDEPDTVRRKFSIWPLSDSEGTVIVTVAYVVLPPLRAMGTVGWMLLIAKLELVMASELTFIGEDP
jgi:hypothetical protein